VLDVWRDGRSKFSEYDVERCAVFGHIAAAAWHNANLYKELENRSVTDNLTGLLNHRWWAELAPREAAQALRNGSQIAVLYVDLDEFKLVNDTYGHAAGDLVLRGVGVALRRSIRSGDAAVRYGGDEFILLLRDCDDQAALQVADQVRKSLDELPSAAVGIEPTTASIGVASFPRHGLSLDDVVHAADSAMYQSKAAGHDQVTVFGGAPTAATGK
jgi:diguanylate cyclase (GGDEF)-like protein